VDIVAARLWARKTRNYEMWIVQKNLNVDIIADDCLWHSCQQQIDIALAQFAKFRSRSVYEQYADQDFGIAPQ
jgi:hypothetical protein